MLHHGNELSHITLIVSELLVKVGVTVLPQKPYNPDLAPVVFFLFSRIKTNLKGKQDMGHWRQSK